MPTERISRLKILLLEDERPQYYVAAACGIHPSELSKYALGQRRPSLIHLRALAKYFDCTQQDLLGWDEITWEH